MKWILFLATLTCTCCSHPQFYDSQSCGQPNVVRCATEYKVEMCGPNGYWMPVMDCSAINESWVCNATDPNDTCVRKAP